MINQHLHTHTQVTHTHTHTDMYWTTTLYTYTAHDTIQRTIAISQVIGPTFTASPGPQLLGTSAVRGPHSLADYSPERCARFFTPFRW